jgi:hypothetical protein
VLEILTGLGHDSGAVGDRPAPACLSSGWTSYRGRSALGHPAVFGGSAVAREGSVLEIEAVMHGGEKPTAGARSVDRSSIG